VSFWILVPSGSFGAGCDDSGGSTTTGGRGNNSIVVDRRAGVDLSDADKLVELSASSSSRRVCFVGLSSAR
jgi:hypothetical protein